MRTWAELDNAAKIFPCTSNADRRNLFRLSFYMTEDVDPALLQKALASTIERFRVFKVRLRAGFFWYYLEENKRIPKVRKEDPYLLAPIDRTENDGYLFRITYYRKKISMEVFHSLTDGYGAMQFLKALVYSYLHLHGYEIDSEGLILSESESVYEEAQDSFQKLYDEAIRPDSSENAARLITGTPYDDGWIGMITGTAPREKFKELITRYDCSYTQFLTAALTYTASQVPHLFKKKKKELPFQVFIPVDIRKRFETKTLRNFSMVMRTSIMPDPALPFSEYVRIAKEQITLAASDEYFLPRVYSNIRSEKNFLLRIVPLFLKNIVMRAVYNRLSARADSICVSNLGDPMLPRQMQPFVRRVIFSNGAMKSAPINLGVTYYGDEIHMNFTASIVERDFQKHFFRLLTGLGLPITLETNDLED